MLVPIPLPIFAIASLNASCSIEDGIIADKQKAYEQAVTSRKQQDKIQSLQDFGFTLDDDCLLYTSGDYLNRNAVRL